MRKILAFILLSGSLAPISVVQGCGTGENLVDPHCEDPKSPGYMKDPACLEGMPKPPPPCECHPNAPNGFDPPQILWLGPSGDVPDRCPAEFGTPGALEVANLFIPPPGCPACLCKEPKGTCSPSPSSILIRSATCAEPISQTIDFGAPESWDGSCTNIHAMAAGAECPAGSGTLCAQSIYTSALPDPIEECEVDPLPSPSAKGPSIDRKPKDEGATNATNDFPAWKDRALSCKPSEIGDASRCTEGNGYRCWPDLPERPAATLEDPDPAGWRYCIRHQGLGAFACPDAKESPYTERVLTFPLGEEIKDTRECTPCTCTASGGTCYGLFSVFEDEACSKLVHADTLWSISHNCDDVIEPGRAIGSKTMTDLEYVPGKCTPHGGAATGDVTVDNDRAQTWCCEPAE